MSPGDEHPYPKEHLAKLVGDDGPAMILFVEMAAKYGLPIRDGSIPLSTEMHVMLTDWRVHLFDVTKAGFPGAIGFKLEKQQRLARFGFWPKAPYGAKQGYFDVFDSNPYVEVFAGRSWRSFGGTTSILSTRVHVDSQDYYSFASKKDKAVWTVINEIIVRAFDLAEQFGYYECDDYKLRD